MTAPKSVDPAVFLREQLDAASPDLLRQMVKTFADDSVVAGSAGNSGGSGAETPGNRTENRTEG